MRRLSNLIGRYSKQDLIAVRPHEKAQEPAPFSDGVSCLSLSRQLKAGWYMLEVAVDLPCAKSIAKVRLDCAKTALELVVYHLPIRSSRTAKRLIHIPSSAYVSFEPTTTEGQFLLRTFRLNKVSQRFANARIKTKLLNRHPLYYKRLFSAQEKKDVYTHLWEDYNAIFERSPKELISYEEWIARIEQPAIPSTAEQQQRMQEWGAKPLFSIITPTYNTPLPVLRACLDSVLAQSYPHWELCIADDASTNPAIIDLLTHYANQDSRIRFVAREKNGHIVKASNAALEMASGDFIVLLDHDDTLPHHALWTVAKALQTQPNAQVIYSDEDKLDLNGHRCEPFFKPDWSIDLLRSQNYISHLGVYRHELVKQVGGFREGFEGSQDYDLLLRCTACIPNATDIVHIPHILYHWRMSSGSASANAGNKGYATESALRALQEHANTMQTGAKVSVIANGLYRHHWPIPASEPLVSLLIPTRDKLELVESCVRSILDKTTYHNYEILILDNGSVNPETLSFFAAIQAENSHVKVLRWDHPFNYSAINNFGSRQANGELLGLINNDIEVISPNWLSEMVSHAIRPDVGCVGAKLFYADDSIQHAGVILGIGGVAGHSHKYFEHHRGGYFSQLRIVRNVSAVTGAALLLRKSVFENVGGLDGGDLKVAFNDVDLCLKVRNMGLINVWTPFAELYHHESKSRGLDITPQQQKRAENEISTMIKRWNMYLYMDPYYNPNLTLSYEDYSLSIESRVPTL